VSYKLAELAKSLEGGYDVERVAHFLKRCLFTMFAEDVGLIEEYSYSDLLEKLKAHPEHFSDSMAALWHTMNTGGFDGQIMQRLPQFNGGLFKGIEPIPLSSDQIQLLIDAAKADWRFVEPAIFGTLLERALDPRERHKLGAHYTPRAYVERLVMPTIIAPLREQWGVVQAAAEMHIQEGKHDKALLELRNFHHKLCETKILDPACGSGNFLYVALEHMKRLEGEVLNVISDLSAGQVGFDTEGLTVDPHQFLGIEINPRAAAVAELVLWIGYLQWHYRIHGTLNIPEPILRDFKNIECRDALIEYDDRVPVVDDDGNPVTIWDGISYKKSPVTGELIPDEQARSQVYNYLNPRKAEWPKSDYIVGNPPFIGGWKMRSALGSGYLESLWTLFPNIPQKADFVMYWWDVAAGRVSAGLANCFGFITTNSITQTFQRRILEKHLSSKKSPLSIILAIPDHPWVDGNDGAAVRIAMSAATAGSIPGKRMSVRKETAVQGGEAEIDFSVETGIIHNDLRVGVDVTTCSHLKSNLDISSPGIQLYGSGFIIERSLADKFNAFQPDSTELHRTIRSYRNAKDIMQTNRGHFVIDFFGLTEKEARETNPAAYQHVLDFVKPERLTNRRASIRDNWWRFGWERPKLRAMTSQLSRFISTPETSKHRVFIFLDSEILPDNKLTNIASDRAEIFSLLTSRVHTEWSLRTGGRLGVGNDPVYVKSRCFETFPFPALTETQTRAICEIGEQIDAHRKRQQSKHDKLTLTGLYNVLEKLRTGETLTSNDQKIHEQGLVSVLRELHDDLDRAVFDAYGWNDLGDILVGLPGATTPYLQKSEEQAEAEEELLKRLVELNHKRASEETQGHVRWLRPEYQAPNETQQGIELRADGEAPAIATASTVTKATFPKEMHEQIRVVLDQLQAGPMEVDTLAANFKRKPVKSVTAVLSALEVLGKAKQEGGTWRV